MEHLATVQILRAIAALSVALGHTQTEALRLAIADNREFHPILLDLTGAGVDLFFVISGFVMVYASRELSCAPNGARIFLERRVARIVPLYWSITALFLGVMAATPSLVSTSWPSLAEIFSSYFFIPYLRPGEEVMQPVYRLGWTLDYEMFFYVAFACVLGLRMNRALAVLSAFFIGLTIAGLLLRPAPGVFFFWSNPIILEFIMGAWIGYARLSNFRISGASAAGLALAGIAGFALQVASGFDAHGAWRPLLWGAPAAAIVAAATLFPWDVSARAWGPVIFLGDASYALYLSHPIALRMLSPLWTRYGLAEHFGDAAYVVAAFVPMPLIACLIYARFEKPLTKALRTRLRALREQGAILLFAGFRERRAPGDAERRDVEAG